MLPHDGSTELLLLYLSMEQKKTGKRGKTVKYLCYAWFLVLPKSVLSHSFLLLSQNIGEQNVRDSVMASKYCVVFLA